MASKPIYQIYAELMAIESACKEHPNLYGELKGTTMYVSCEPCYDVYGSNFIWRNFKNCLCNYYRGFIRKEVIGDINELAKCAKSNIEIVNEYKREEGLEVLKSYEFWK